MRRRRPRKRAIKKFKPNLKYLHEYEREVILADCRQVGRVTIHSLTREFPGRYNKRYLASALIRMSKDGHLVNTRRQERIGFGPRATVYRLPDAIQKRKAA